MPCCTLAWAWARLCPGPSCSASACWWPRLTRFQPGGGAPGGRDAAAAYRGLAQRDGDGCGGRGRSRRAGGLGRCQSSRTSFNRWKTRCGSRSIAGSRPAKCPREPHETSPSLVLLLAARMLRLGAEAASRPGSRAGSISDFGGCRIWWCCRPPYATAGSRVTDLDSKDFEVFEDGAAQPIRLFRHRTRRSPLAW